MFEILLGFILAFVFYKLFIAEDRLQDVILPEVHFMFVRVQEDYERQECNVTGTPFEHLNRPVNMEFVTMFERAEPYKGVAGIRFTLSHNPMEILWAFEDEEIREDHFQWLLDNWSEEGPY